MQYKVDTVETLREEMASLPKGTIVYKSIGGKKRPYLQWKEAGKTKNKYLKADELEKVMALVEKRRQLEAKLKSMDFSVHENKSTNETIHDFHTNVIYGDYLNEFISDVASFDKRDCFKIVEEYLSASKKDIICALYGLRRTGKTVMLKQAIAGIKNFKQNAAYIKLRTTDDMESLNEDIKYLQASGIRYLFLDEITLLENFIDGASLFSDVFAATGMKIVVSGTDSLGFWLSSSNELYDRVILVHTSHVSYQEHSRLLGISDIDEYIKYGGTLRAGELSFDEGIDIRDASFRDDESARRYIDTAIAYNIQNSLRYFKGGYFRNLKDLYEADELTNAINRVVENENHEFTVEIIKKIFKSGDLGSASQIAMSSADSTRRSDILSKIDKQTVTNKLMSYLDIRNDLKVDIKPHQVAAIKEYLKALDLFDDINISYAGDAPATTKSVLSLPGLRYCQAQALINALSKDAVFGKTDRKTQALIQEIIEEDVCGKILEEIVVFETKKHIEDLHLKCEVGKLLFPDGEIDMYVFDEEEYTCDLFEIKHSKEINSKQQRHLLDRAKCAKVESYFGEIKSKNVIYRGQTQELDNGVNYINVQEYLSYMGG